jgi:diacylglycerol kinase family enzyme
MIVAIPDAEACSDAAPDLKTLRIGALINTSSGNCTSASEAELIAILREFGLTTVYLWCGIGANYPAALEHTRAIDVDLLIVLGGDGTIRAAAEGCKARRPILAPLPGGTMNVLPKAVYGERSWTAALRATLQRPALRYIGGAEVQGHRFFVSGIFGSMAGLCGVREAFRIYGICGALEKEIAVMRGVASTLRYDFEGRTGVSQTVAVICGPSRFADGVSTSFEAAAMKMMNPFSVMRLAIHTLFDGWRQDPDVVHAHVNHLTISSDGPIDAMLDGETFDLGHQANVNRVPHAFTALLPWPEHGPVSLTR